MDAALPKHILSVIVTLCVSLDVVYGARCYYSTSSLTRRRTGYKYCSTSCCGTISNRYCCGHSELPFTTIAVIVIAVVVAVTVFVLIICCRRRRSTPGQIVTTQQTPVMGFSVVQTGNVNPVYNGNVNPGFNGNIYSGNPGYNVSPSSGYTPGNWNPGLNGNASPMYAGTGSVAPNNQLPMPPQQLNAGVLSPPAYESLGNMPANEPPQYSSLYKP